MNRLIDRAHRFLSTARRNLDDGDVVSAADRVYYAGFDAARAAVAAVVGIDPMSIKTHSGLWALFAEHVVKPGLLEAEVARAIRRSESIRLAAVYSDIDVTVEAVADGIANTDRFIAACSQIVDAHQGAARDPATTMTSATITGGCQCGAVRFACESLGRASICHCRMCQKAMGGYFGPFVTANGLAWTRGKPKRYRSSNEAQRGFCADCGTPLTFELADSVDVAIGAFDDAASIAPAIQLATESRLPSFDTLASLPVLADPDGQIAARLARVVSYQHPDHDTARWPPEPR